MNGFGTSCQLGCEKCWLCNTYYRSHPVVVQEIGVTWGGHPSFWFTSHCSQGSTDWANAVVTSVGLNQLVLPGSRAPYWTVSLQQLKCTDGNWISTEYSCFGIQFSTHSHMLIGIEQKESRRSSGNAPSGAFRIGTVWRQGMGWAMEFLLVDFGCWLCLWWMGPEIWPSSKIHLMQVAFFCP